MAPLTMWDEVNTGTNLPAEIKIAAVDGDAYKFLFMAKGGGSANKSYLFQETKALLNPTSLAAFLDEKLRTLGTAACPPYHLAIVIGGTSAEYALKTAKLASARYLDTLPTTGNELGRGLPRRRARGGGPRAHPADRHRRAVRRQVLLPRRARHPPAPPRRLVPGGHRRVVLGRPPGARQDHRRRRLPRAARDRPGALPASNTYSRTGRTTSLHVAFATLAAGFWWSRLRSPARWLLWLYPVAMSFSLAYGGEHYVTDELAGVLYAALILLVARLLGRPAVAGTATT